MREPLASRDNVAAEELRRLARRESDGRVACGCSPWPTLATACAAKRRRGRSG
jgi:hypothetical protein